MQGTMVRSTLAGIKTQTRRIMNPQPPEWCGEAHARSLTPPDCNCTGCKTGTRHCEWYLTEAPIAFNAFDATCPYGVPGDLLWVREAWSANADEIAYQERSGQWQVYIDRDHPHFQHLRKYYDTQRGSFRPSIHMPRWACRLVLKITQVRAHRLQDITVEDAIAEGIEPLTHVGPLRAKGWRDYSGGAGFLSPLDSFRSLWNSINLQPRPLLGRNLVTGKKEIVGYVSYPWSEADFDLVYPVSRELRQFAGKPLTVIANPWIWAVSFALHSVNGQPVTAPALAA